MQRKHTPGPWTVQEEIDGPVQNTRIVAHKKAVASTAQQCGRPHHWNEAEANARLIAAAPELLEACEALVNAYSIHDGTVHARAVDVAVAAIRKATGEATDGNA